MGMIGSLKNANGTTLFKMYESHADARRQAFRVHYHTEIELSLIRSGSGTYNSDGKLYPVAAGDIFFYKSSVPHCMTDIADGGMQILNIHISPIYFHLLRTNADSAHFGRAFLSGSFESVKLTDLMTESQSEEIRRLFDAIEAGFKNEGMGFELLCEAYLAQILVRLSRYMTPRNRHSGVEGSDTVFRTLEFIDAHYTETISLFTLSEFARLEKTYFATLFKRVIGTNPWEYILIKRIEKSIELLRASNRNVLEIASEVGFNNTANFNKIFKKYTGMTPKELRKTSKPKQ